MDNKGVGVSLAAMVVVQALVSMATFTVPVFAPTAARDIGISATSVGIYVGLIYIAGIVSSLWSGDFICRYGALRVCQAALIVCGIGLAMSAAASLPVMALSALVLGLGYGPVNPASSHILSVRTPARMLSIVFSVKQTGVPLGGTVAGAVVPALVMFVGWKQAAVILGVVCGLGALLVQPIRRMIDNDRQPIRQISLRSIADPLKMILTRRPLLRLAIISFFYSGMQMCLITYLVTYLTQKIGMALITAGLILSAAQIAGVIGRIMWGLMADRLCRPMSVLGLIGMTMSLGAIATANFSPDWPYPVIWAGSIVFGASAIGWNGVFLAETARLAPNGQVSAATGGCMFFAFSGAVVGPPVFAAVAALTGSYALGYLIFAGFTSICAGIAIFSGYKRTNSDS